jgi:hypothetical protein
MFGRWIDRTRVRWRSREEASTILSPCSFATGVVLRCHAKALAADKLSGERIAGYRSRRQRRTRDFVAPPQVDGNHHNNRRDSDEAKRAAKRAKVGNWAAHQWNICAEPA